jgi:acetyl esterase/lipase
MPELDDRLDTVSMQNFTDTPMWHRRNAELSWQYYLGDNYTPGADNVPAYAAPARLVDASGLPPAYITAMEFDPLRDEDVLYALKLMQAGVSVELHTFPGTFHGSAMLQHAAVSQRQQQELKTILTRALRLDIKQDKK